MSGKCRPSLRSKTLANVMNSELSLTDKECIKAVFDKLTAIEAEPVKHGRWVETKTGFHCSCCKKKPGRHPTKPGAFLSDCCPNCGAKMDEEATHAGD